MGLSVPYTTPRGHQVVVNSDVLDVAARIQRGDPTCGWEGDPRMFVVFNYVTEKYEVWRRCEDNKDRIIMSAEPREFDARVIVRLVQSDTRHVNVLAEMEKHNERVERQQQEEHAEMMKEVNDILARGAMGSYLPGVDVHSPGVHHK